MIFELSAPKHFYLEKNSKIIRFQWLNTEKHGFLYDRMILEPSTLIFELSAVKHSYLENLSKSIHFQWLNTEKHGFIYHRISLDPSNRDFPTQKKKNKKNHDFPKKLNIFENTHESQLFRKFSYVVALSSSS